MAAGGFFTPVFIFNEVIKKQRTFIDPLDESYFLLFLRILHWITPPITAVSTIIPKSGKFICSIPNAKAPISTKTNTIVSKISKQNTFSRFLFALFCYTALNCSVFRMEFQAFWSFSFLWAGSASRAGGRRPCGGPASLHRSPPDRCATQTASHGGGPPDRPPAPPGWPFRPRWPPRRGR